MKTEFNIEELIFLKEASVSNVQFLIFQNNSGEMRAVEANKLNSLALQAGEKVKAKIRKKGCAGKAIEEIFVD